mgnify:CR=1 FL=1
MNGVTFNPDDWKDVFVLVFLGICSVATAGIPVMSKLRKIDTQVSNSHDENLRDEITRGFREIRADIRLLSDELHIERKERIKGDLRIEGE